MGWKDIPPPTPTPPGAWEEFSYGTDYRAWVLRCGPAMVAHITHASGQFYSTINHAALPVSSSLQEAQLGAEEAIVIRVRELLPAYKAIVERLETKTDERANITTLTPKR